MLNNYALLRHALKATDAVRGFCGEAPEEYMERAHNILIGMAPYHLVAAQYHIDSLGYAHG